MAKERKDAKKASGKTNRIVLWSVFAVLLAGTIVAFIFSQDLYGLNGFFATTVVSDIQAVQWMFYPMIPNIVHTVQIIAVAIGLALLVHYGARITFRTPKTITIARLLANFFKWAIAIATFFLILDAWGAPASAMIASAGVITLIIGLGSQALVADILAGVFIVFEGDFQVGDIIVVDGWRGEVQSIGIRTTKLIDAGYNVKIVNNSQIKTIINQTKELSLAKCYVSTRYEDRIENIEAIIADNIDKIKEKIPAIVEGPYYKGVAELGESSVDLLFVAKCKEADIYQVQRDLNREIKIMFDNNDIGIPFPQIVIHKGEDDKKDTVSAKTIKKAQEFTEEQKELSKDIDIQK